MSTIRIWRKWAKLLIRTVSRTIPSEQDRRMNDRLGYFDRYSKMKILQIQTGGDEFFLPDNEVWPIVRLGSRSISLSGRLLVRSANGNRWFIFTVSRQGDGHDSATMDVLLQSITQCWTFLRRTRSQFVLQHAKFLFEHLRSKKMFDEVRFCRHRSK